MTATVSDFFICLATLSLSFVGFSAVVVSLRGALGGEISDRHLRLVRLYIEGGLIVTALALIPVLLSILHVSEAGIWRAASAAAALIFSALMLIQFSRRRAVEAGRFPGWVVTIYAISLVTVIGLWLNGAGVPFAPTAGPYAVALTWALFVFGFIFVRTIDIFLHRPRP
ncbi:MAG: hypothetical protein WBC37_16905 [Burkholderiaceae bacterium]